MRMQPLKTLHLRCRVQVIIQLKIKIDATNKTLISAKNATTGDTANISCASKAPSTIHKDFTVTVAATVLSYIASNKKAFAAVHEDGTVKTWGCNTSGGDNTTANGLQEVKSIFSLAKGFVAVKKDGTVFAWGSELYDINTEAAKVTPSDHKDKHGCVAGKLSCVKAIYLNTNDTAFAALKEDGTVVTWAPVNLSQEHEDEGSNSSKVQPAPTDIADKNGCVPHKLSCVKAIYPAEQAFAALKTDGSVVTWGNEATGGGGKMAVYNGESYVSDLTASLVHVKAIYSTNYGHLRH